MPYIRIEFNRNDGMGWRIRQAGDMDITPDQLAAELPRYCSQYPHRVFVDDKLIAKVAKPRYLESVVKRYD